MEAIRFLRMLRRRWAVVVGLTVVGLVVGVLGALRVSGDASDDEAPVFYAANHLLLSRSGGEGAQLGLSRAALFVTAGDVPTNVAEELGRDRFDLLSRVATIEEADVRSLTVSAVSTDPEDARLVASAFADGLVAYLLAQDEEGFEARVARAEGQIDAHLAVIEALDSQISALRGGEGGGGSQLEVLSAERSSRRESYEAALERLDEIQASPPRPAFTTLEISEPFTISQGAYERRLRDGRTGRANYAGPDALPAGGQGFASSVTDSPVVLVAGGGLVGLLLGVVVALTLARMDYRITSRDEAEEFYGLPVIAEIPMLRRVERRSSDVVTHIEPKSNVAEAYRGLKSSLVYSRELGDHAAVAENTGRRPEVVMVTSADAREGKTSTTANLAAALAEDGYSVLALNCDFRRPQLVHYLRGRPEPRTVSDTEIAGVMMVNHVTAEGPEALPSDALRAQRQVIERARGSFDVILLDTAPLLAVNDANELLPHADMVIVVAQVGRSKKEAAVAAGDMLARRNAPVVGVVLVGVPETSSSRSYYYYSREVPDTAARSNRSDERPERAARGDDALAAVAFDDAPTSPDRQPATADPDTPKRRRRRRRRRVHDDDLTDAADPDPTEQHQPTSS